MKSLFNGKQVVVQVKPVPKKRDIFDEIELEGKDVFKKIIPPTKEELEKRLAEARLIERIKKEVLATIKIPSAPPAEIKIVEKIVEKKEEPKVEGPDDEEIAIEELKSEIAKLKTTLEDQSKKISEFQDAGPIFIPASPIIPSWSGQKDKILTNNGEGLSWRSYDATGGAFYLGDQTTDGSWRLFISDTSLLVQRLESGTWTEKGAFLA